MINNYIRMTIKKDVHINDIAKGFHYPGIFYSRMFNEKIHTLFIRLWRIYLRESLKIRNE